MRVITLDGNRNRALAVGWQARDVRSGAAALACRPSAVKLSRPAPEQRIQMKRVFVLLAFTTLGGCLPERAKDVAICRIEADRFYEGYRAVDVESPRSEFIIGCMANKGYNFTIMSADCNSQRPLATQPTCYASNSWLSWIIDRFSAQ